MNESCAHVKPKENILVISVLLIAVSCLTGVCCGLKSQQAKFIGLTDDQWLYENNPHYSNSELRELRDPWISLDRREELLARTKDLRK